MEKEILKLEDVHRGDEEFVISDDPQETVRVIAGADVDITNNRVRPIVRYAFTCDRNIVIPFAPSMRNERVLTAEVLDTLAEDADVKYVLFGTELAEDCKERGVVIFENRDKELAAPKFMQPAPNVYLIGMYSAPDLVRYYDEGNTGFNSVPCADVDSERRRLLVATLVESRNATAVAHVDKVKNALENSLHQMRDYKTRAIELAREAEAQQLALAKIASGDVGLVTSEEIEEAVSALYESPLFVSVKVSSDSILTFETALISIMDESGYEHPIGEFEVSVNLNNCEVEMLNLDNRGRDEDFPDEYRYEKMPNHPHVDSDGVPCMGNLAEYITEPCAEYDIVAIWQLIVSYLTSYNSDDIWGKRLHYWRTEDGELVREDGDEMEECACCGAVLFNDEDIYTCDDCGAVICEDCYTCSAEGDYYCNACKDKHYSSVDDEYMPRCVDIISCPECGATFTDDTYDTYYGTDGEMYCCEACAESAGAIESEDENDD